MSNDDAAVTEPAERDAGSELRLMISRPRPDVVVAAVRGSLDIATDPELRRRLDELPSQHLILDLTELEFLAARGVGTLLALAETRMRAGATLHLTGLSGNASISRVFELLSLGDALDIHPSVGDALAALAVPAGNSTDSTSVVEMRPDHAARYRQRAREARDYADHERREQHRLRRQDTDESS